MKPPKINIKNADLPDGLRTAKPSETATGDELHPKFSFEFLTGDYCLTKCETKARGHLASKLHYISQQTWRDLRLLGRKSGFEPIPLNELRCKIPTKFKTENQSIVFHMTGNIPIIGIRENEVFYIIAIDRNFSAYDHGN